MFNPSLERKATKIELAEAQQVYSQLTQRGLSATYAGGERSKGQGFWVTGRGYLNCADCLKLNS